MDSAPACMSILSRQHPLYASSVNADTSMNLLSAAAHLLLAAEALDEGLLARLLTSVPELAAQARCEMFAQLLLADQGRSILSRFCPNIARSTSLCLRAVGDLLSVADTGGEGAEMLAAVFNVTRLVLMIPNEPSHEGLWDRTWPDWHRLVTISTEKICVNAVSLVPTNILPAN